MDIKTLEYMEKRAEKGRELVTQIEKLKKRIEILCEVEVVNFKHQYNGVIFDSSLGGANQAHEGSVSRSCVERN